MEWQVLDVEENFLNKTEYLLALLIQIVYNALRSENSETLTLEEILYPRRQRESQDEQVAADMEWIEAMIASGKVVDLRTARNKKL